MEGEVTLGARQDLDALVLDESGDLDCGLDLILFIDVFDHECRQHAVVVQILAQYVAAG